MAAFRLVFALALLCGLAAAQLEGWRMTDRFTGIRYEVHGHVQGVGFRRALVDKADELACFGWTQNTASGTVVGEARCSKRAAPELIAFLKKGPRSATVDHVDIHEYEDTKIRLHFSHFRILDDARVTCFQTAPHQCPGVEGLESHEHVEL